MTRNKFITLLFIFVSSVYMYAFSGGVTGTTRKNGNGCTCHGGASKDVIVRITGPDTVKINDTASYIIKLSGGPIMRGGTNIATGKGILIAGERLRLFNSELTHSSPFIPHNDTVTINFKYIAPSSLGTDTIFANGNSVNFDGFTTGDKWNFAINKKVEIVNTTGIIDLNSLPQVYSLKQNFPNPFNPVTNLEFEISPASRQGGDLGFVTLKIYDSIGREVAVIVNSDLNSGTYKYEFNSSGMASGIYFYQMTVSNGKSEEIYREKKKMIILK
ncbi:MAG: choice-of-anchor V domain-containing protein [Ignavibacteria bacterium]